MNAALQHYYGASASPQTLGPALIDQNRFTKIFLQAVTLYLATSFLQLEAKQGSWLKPGGISFKEVSSALLRHVREVGRAEQNEAYPFAPGN